MTPTRIGFSGGSDPLWQRSSPEGMLSLCIHVTLSIYETTTNYCLVHLNFPLPIKLHSEWHFKTSLVVIHHACGSISVFQWWNVGQRHLVCCSIVYCCKSTQACSPIVCIQCSRAREPTFKDLHCELPELEKSVKYISLTVLSKKDVI